MMQDLLLAATLLALVSVVVFIVAYARLPWYASSLGRAIMAGGFAVGLLSGVGAIRRFDNRFNDGGLADWLTVGSTLAYLIVAAVWSYKTRTVLKGGPDDDKRKRR